MAVVKYTAIFLHPNFTLSNLVLVHSAIQLIGLCTCALCNICWLDLTHWPLWNTMLYTVDICCVPGQVSKNLPIATMHRLPTEPDVYAYLHHKERACSTVHDQGVMNDCQSVHCVVETTEKLEEDTTDRMESSTKSTLYTQTDDCIIVTDFKLKLMTCVHSPLVWGDLVVFVDSTTDKHLHLHLDGLMMVSMAWCQWPDIGGLMFSMAWCSQWPDVLNDLMFLMTWCSRWPDVLDGLMFSMTWCLMDYLMCIWKVALSLLHCAYTVFCFSTGGRVHVLSLGG